MKLTAVNHRRRRRDRCCSRRRRGRSHPQTILKMPTQKECQVCKKKIGVASKTCAHCGAKQPYKQKLENIKRKLSHGWKERQKKNSSVNKVYDATSLLLHKWELLERHPMLLLARRTTHGFLAECLCPWQMKAEDGKDAKDALATIKKIYESLLNVALPVGPAGGSGQSPAADDEVPSATQKETPPPGHHHHALPSNKTAEPASSSLPPPLLGPQLHTEFTFVITPGSSSLVAALPSSSSLTHPASSSSLCPPTSPPLASPVSPTLSMSPRRSLSPLSTPLDDPDSDPPSWTRTEGGRLDPSGMWVYEMISQSCSFISPSCMNRTCVTGDHIRGRTD